MCSSSKGLGSPVFATLRLIGHAFSLLLWIDWCNHTAAVVEVASSRQVCGASPRELISAAVAGGCFRLIFAFAFVSFVVRRSCRFAIGVFVRGRRRTRATPASTSQTTPRCSGSRGGDLRSSKSSWTRLPAWTGSEGRLPVVRVLSSVVALVMGLPPRACLPQHVRVQLVVHHNRSSTRCHCFQEIAP